MILRSVVFCVLSIASTGFAGTWTRVSQNTISLSGPIAAEEYRKFQAIFRPSDKTLIVNSQGGNVEAGVKIGNTIFENKMDIVVRGMCASSCANYLFTAGKRKMIENGFVGFHGNWKAWVGTDDYWDEIINNTPSGPRRREKVNYINKVVKDETEFLLKVGVSQDLFAKTQMESDKGKYAIYLPTIKTFKKYGIKSVEGVQNIEFLKFYKGASFLVE